eukprot:gnl/Trimastix_PCT/3276.p2 GENE.gnl/Trimastix_PCT/3276~~gnl/Trimastix_PCT/3276.p2  ORF type:complete len:149 (+),score=20.37 gnl/Trimastix_PCT/3276:56-502(+)
MQRKTDAELDEIIAKATAGAQLFFDNPEAFRQQHPQPKPKVVKRQVVVTKVVTRNTTTTTPAPPQAVSTGPGPASTSQTRIHVNAPKNDSVGGFFANARDEMRRFDDERYHQRLREMGREVPTKEVEAQRRANQERMAELRRQFQRKP